ncbi:pancreatic triacylglycerol lipase-like isoform X4 [Engystomops pustulosus]|uniref:pancreatic triacylglycerol lipase-like isoform X4 n=1 Tax=Engystomops pustulosus TaxID=76066 RepID=UPI003AFA7E5C
MLVSIVVGVHLKSKINICHERIAEVKQELQGATRTQEEKSSQVAIMLERGFQVDLLKNRQEGLKTQEMELLRENQDLLSNLQQIKEDMAAEEEKFMNEVQDFNNNYGIMVNRKDLLRERAKTESQSLQEEAVVLGREIETLRAENIHLNTLHRQKNMFQRKLSDFQETLRGLDKEIIAVTGVTKRLVAEKLAIREKPQSDRECLRLKEQLESYREEKLESEYQALRSQIDVLQQMMLLWTIGIFFFSAVKGAEVCYNRLGCFNDAKPWAGTVERPFAKLPWAPEKINTRFLLYTRNNQNSYQAISATNPSSISSSNFRTSRKTRFVIHGFTDSGEATWLSDICRRLFQIEDSNCICVDWSGGSRTLYSQASNNIRVVGAEVAYFIGVLQSNFGYAPGNVHVIGHSLGAHTAGEAGRRQRGIGRITGLDPAEPYFQNTPAEVRLDPSDANLVDVIHTDSGPLVPTLGFGTSQNSGHLDFFPNGGVHMPGCPKNIEIPNVNVEDIWSGVVNFVTCNHMRAIKYYTDSITNSNTFVSYPCSNWNTYQGGSCRSCPSAGCPKMGHYADTFRGVTSSSQVFYTTTP